MRRPGSWGWLSGSPGPTSVPTLHNIPYQKFTEGASWAALGLLAGLTGCVPGGLLWMNPVAVVVAPDAIDLGAAPLDGLAQLDVPLSLDGDAALSLRLEISPDGFQVSPSALDLDPGQTRYIVVRFQADGLLGPQSGLLGLVPVDAPTMTTVEIPVLVDVLADFDGDGHAHIQAGGDDCDDEDAAVFPGAAEVFYDGLDADCDGNDDDQDGDGYAALVAGGDDCNDRNPAVHPGAPDAWYDGVDADCDGNDDDQDGDGYAALVAGGDDCDDLDPAIHPLQADAYDGLDNDCDGVFDEDDMPAGALVISEIYAPVGADAAGWLEVQGLDSRSWRLDGWSVGLEGASEELALALDGLVLGAGQRLVLCVNEAAALDLNLRCDRAGLPPLDPQAGALRVGPTEAAVDRLPWDGRWVLPADGSLQLDSARLVFGLPDATVNDAADAWCPSWTPWATGPSGSPGAANPACP